MVAKLFRVNSMFKICENTIFVNICGYCDWRSRQKPIESHNEIQSYFYTRCINLQHVDYDLETYLAFESGESNDRLFETMQDALRRFHWQQAYKQILTDGYLRSNFAKPLVKQKLPSLSKNYRVDGTWGALCPPHLPLITATAGDWSQLTSPKFILTAMRSQCSRITYRHMLLNEFKNFTQHGAFSELLKYESTQIFLKVS